MSPAASPPRQRRPRIPAFVPVPTRARRDGWSPARQAGFIGALAETGSVAAAAARVGMSRESAWRLRLREGADSFAAAWDAARAIGADATGTFWEAPIAPKRKITPAELRERALEGVLRVVLRGGRHAWTERKPDNSALLRWLRVLDRSRLLPPGSEWDGPPDPEQKPRLASTSPHRSAR